MGDSILFLKKTIMRRANRNVSQRRYLMRNSSQICEQRCPLSSDVVFA